MIDVSSFRLLTILLGIRTFLIRFSFLGLLGGKALSPRALLHLKYVGVSVLPALVAPLVVWPDATQGELDPIRLVAAVAALVAGLRFGVIWALVSGMGTLYLLQFLLQL